MSFGQPTREELYTMLLPYLEQGHSIAGLADALGIHHRRIKRALSKAGKDYTQYEQQRIPSLSPNSLSLADLWQEHLQNNPAYADRLAAEAKLKELWDTTTLSPRRLSALLPLTTRQIERIVLKEAWKPRGTVRSKAVSEEEVVKLHKHLSIKEIAARMQIGPARISAILYRHGLALRPGRQSVLTPEEQEEAATLYQQKKTIREIAEWFGVTKNAVEDVAFRLNDRKRRASQEAL